MDGESRSTVSVRSSRQRSSICTPGDDGGVQRRWHPRRYGDDDSLANGRADTDDRRIRDRLCAHLQSCGRDDLALFLLHGSVPCKGRNEEKAVSRRPQSCNQGTKGVPGTYKKEFKEPKEIKEIREGGPGFRGQGGQMSVEERLANIESMLGSGGQPHSLLDAPRFGSRGVEQWPDVRGRLRRRG